MQTFTEDYVPAVLNQFAGAGVRWARAQILWSVVEPTNTTPPTYNWFATDRAASALAEAGFATIFTVYHHPSWAATTDCGRIDKVPLTRYQAFLGALVERYDGDGIADAPRSPRVGAWEIMNEPDFNLQEAKGEDDYGGCFGADPSGYGTLLRAAFLAVKGADPSAQVVFGGVAYDRFYNKPDYGGPGGPFDYHFVGNVLSWLKLHHGGESQWPFFNQVGVHVYNDFRNNWDGPQPYNQELVGKVSHFRGNQLFRAGQFDLTGVPVDVSEASLPSLPGDTFTNRSETLQAIYPGQMMARAKVADAIRATWFLAEDNFTGPCDSPYSWFTFGLLRSLAVFNAAQGCPVNPLPGYSVSMPHEPKPALTALGVAAAQLAGATFDTQLGPLQTGSMQIEAHRFLQGGTAVIIAFTDNGERIGRRASPPVQRNMTFDASVLPGWTGRIAVTSHMGNVIYRDGTSIVLTLTQAPVYVRPVPLAAQGDGWRKRIVSWLTGGGR